MATPLDSPPHPAAAAPRLQVLVVDDERPNLSTFRRAFRAAMDVTVAEGPRQALVLLESQRFDVAFVDYRMPVMNGLDLMREMQRVAPAMRRILLTGYPGLSDAEDACRNGLCERIMAKPWRKAELLAYLTESQPHG